MSTPFEELIVKDNVLIADLLLKMKVPVYTVKDICEFNIMGRGKDDHFLPVEPAKDL